MDVTGERPLVVPKADGGLRLARDPEGRSAKFVARKVSSESLKSEGLKLDVPPGQAIALLIRPAGEPVWNCVPDYTLKALAGSPCAIVLPDDSEAKLVEFASRLEAFLKSKKVPVDVKRAADVKSKPNHHEVWITSKFKGVPQDYKGYFVDVFNNEPLVTDRHLIVLGSEEANALTKHLGKSDAFCYDKVLFKVTGAFPGGGPRDHPDGGVRQLPVLQRHRRLARGDRRRGLRPHGDAGRGRGVSKVIADMPAYTPPVKEVPIEVFTREEVERMKDRGNVDSAPGL